MRIGSFLKRHIDLWLTAVLAIFYTCASLIHFLKSYLLGRSRGETLDIEASIIVFFFDWVTVMVYMQIIAITVSFLLEKKVSWKKIVPLHFIFFLLLGITLQFSNALVRGAIKGIPDFFTTEGFEALIVFLDLDFLTYFSMVFIIYSYSYFKSSREVERQKMSLENQVVKSKMKMLTSQIQPHFLFNTINCIVSLIESNPKKAQDTLVDLSNFFRAVTHQGDSHFISIEKEIQILRYYLDILKVRFQENLIIEENYEEELSQDLIPGIILQPLIENSVNHGYSYSKEELVIKISIFSKDNYIFLIVENNGALIKGDPFALKNGIGLTNIDERLQNLYKYDYCFTVRNKADGSGVENIIRIPLVGLEVQKFESLKVESLNV